MYFWYTWGFVVCVYYSFPALQGHLSIFSSSHPAPPLPIIHSSLEFTPLIYKADKCLIVVVFNFVCILWPILTVSYNKYILLYSSHKALEIFFGSWNLYSPLYLTWFKMYGLISCILWHALLFGGIVKEDLSLSYPSPPNLSSYPILSAIGRNFPF